MRSSRNKSEKLVGAVVRSVIRDVTHVYPYFLVLYAVALLLSTFFPRLSGAFYWPAVHGSVIFFGLLVLASGIAGAGRASNPLMRSFRVPMRSAVRALRLFNFGRIRLALSEARAGFVRARRRVAVTVIVIGVALCLHANPWDIALLLYAVATIVYRVIDIRVTAVIALALLAACPVSQVFGTPEITAQLNVYAFIMLGVAVGSQVAILADQKN